MCVIDDDRDKLGKYIRNVKIAGTRDDIVALAQSRRIEEIVLAIPTAAVPNGEIFCSFAKRQAAA